LLLSVMSAAEAARSHIPHPGGHFRRQHQGY
jgi:hypothetical protein